MAINYHKIRLVSKIGNNRINDERVVFDVSPDLSESRNVQYKTVNPIHMPGSIYVYENTSARVFSIDNIKLIARNQQEAQQSLDTIQMLRSWTMPRFGVNSSTIDQNQRNNRRRRANGEVFETVDFNFGAEQLGAPPPVLLLSAYENDKPGTRRRSHLRNIPVVITQLSIPYPSDVDYLQTADGVPVPTIISLNVILNESHSPREYNNFSLNDFKRGQLEGF